MQFCLSEEQTLLKNSVSRFCAALASAKPAQGGGQSRWLQFAGLGLLGLPFSEDYGGTAGTPAEAMIVAEEIGRNLLIEPFVPAIVVAAGLVAEVAAEVAKQALLPSIAEGHCIVVPAFWEPGSRYDLAHVETMATQSGRSYMLRGRKSVVLDGADANYLLVSARLSGGLRDPAGIGLFLVPTHSPGVVVRATETLDGRSAAEVYLDGAHLGADSLLVPAGQALPLIERAVDRGTAAICAEAVGAMSALFELTVEYLRTRRQFGAPLGKFQALQHRVVDMRIALELSRSMAAAAASAVALEDAEERRRIVSAAKVQVDRGGRYLGQQAIQLHGAMGMTDEYAAGRYVKRLLVLSSLYGDIDYHLDRFHTASASWTKSAA